METLWRPEISRRAEPLFQAVRDTPAVIAVRNRLLESVEDLGLPKREQGRDLLWVDKALGKISTTKPVTEIAALLLAAVTVAVIITATSSPKPPNVEQLANAYRTWVKRTINLQ
ncbi:hypothetical protein PAE0137 [Pyrobaculum aerophilum str. IM2]|uniref:Uncharacterized protein n=2 Tax=Pyrobaculum aerophilum TaxID=13773 RepID=Q8ZZQ3_PYRAE|nr:MULTISPECIES: hypothetical protein [Pyrobaculum]AAL62586.1 hypothetical protein PAE0137 [Pyrobaculum aerophilum str. IM2]HII46796.1 hypothetical protein [Pyrobaculum aerophilum]